MTAKLPPLPPYSHLALHVGDGWMQGSNGWNEGAMHVYALQAVRDALKRGIEDLRNLSVSGGTTQLRQAALDRLRALLKEYSDE